MADTPVLKHRLSTNPGTPTILYLHGFLGCLDDWQEITENLGVGFSHLTVDLPGHRMPADRLADENYTMPGCAALVIDLLDHLQIEQTHLVGYSMGGRLGLFLLTHYPERFDKAVIESASPGLKTDGERAARREHEQQLMEQLYRQPFNQFLHDWYAQPLFQSMDKSDPRFDLMLDRRRNHDSKALILSLKHMGTSVQPSLWDAMLDLSTSLLFIAGSEDSKYRGLAEEMVNLCPCGVVTIIQNAGHNPHWECPVEFCRIVEKFLTRRK